MTAMGYEWNASKGVWSRGSPPEVSVKVRSGSRSLQLVLANQQELPPKVQAACETFEEALRSAAKDAAPPTTLSMLGAEAKTFAPELWLFQAFATVVLVPVMANGLTGDAGALGWATLLPGLAAGVVAAGLERKRLDLLRGHEPLAGGFSRLLADALVEAPEQPAAWEWRATFPKWRSFAAQYELLAALGGLAAWHVGAQGDLARHLAPPLQALADQVLAADYSSAYSSAPGVLVTSTGGSLLGLGEVDPQVSLAAGLVAAVLLAAARGAAALAVFEGAYGAPAEAEALSAYRVGDAAVEAAHRVERQPLTADAEYLKLEADLEGHLAAARLADAWMQHFTLPTNAKELTSGLAALGALSYGAAFALSGGAFASVLAAHLVVLLDAYALRTGDETRGHVTVYQHGDY